MASLPEQAARKPTVLRADRDEPTASLGDRVRSLQLDDQIANRRIVPARFLWTLVLMLAGLCGWLAYVALVRKPTESTTAATTGATAGKTTESSSSAGDGAASPTSSTSFSAGGVSNESDDNIALVSRGYIVPRKRILVSPKVSGMIVALNIEEGRSVREGEELARLESTEYEAEVSRVKAVLSNAEEQQRELEAGNRPEEISQSRAELREAEAQLAQMSAEYNRTVDLRRKGIKTQAEFEESEAKYRAQLRRVDRLQFALKLSELGPRQERVTMAKAQVAQARAELIKAQWKLDNCIIRSTIRGTILTKNAEKGNIVNPIAFQGSYSLCEMADLSDMEVDLNIQERDVARVYQGQPCRITCEAYPQRFYDGHVSRLMPIADRAKGAVPVRVKINIPADEDGKYLKPEMGANVTFFKTAAKATPKSAEKSPAAEAKD